MWPGKTSYVCIQSCFLSVGDATRQARECPFSQAPGCSWCQWTASTATQSPLTDSCTDRTAHGWWLAAATYQAIRTMISGQYLTPCSPWPCHSPQIVTTNSSAFANPIWQMSCPCQAKVDNSRRSRIVLGTFSLQAVLTLQGCSPVSSETGMTVLTLSRPTAPGLLHALPKLQKLLPFGPGGTSNTSKPQ